MVVSVLFARFHFKVIRKRLSLKRGTGNRKMRMGNEQRGTFKTGILENSVNNIKYSMLSTVLTAKAVLLIVENVSIFNELHSFIYLFCH